MTKPFKISCKHLILLRVNEISQIKNLTPRAEYIQTRFLKIIGKFIMLNKFHQKSKWMKVNSILMSNNRKTK